MSHNTQAGQTPAMNPLQGLQQELHRLIDAEHPDVQALAKLVLDMPRFTDSTAYDLALRKPAAFINFVRYRLVTVGQLPAEVSVFGNDSGEHLFEFQELVHIHLYRAGLRGNPAYAVLIPQQEEHQERPPPPLNARHTPTFLREYARILDATVSLQIPQWSATLAEVTFDALIEMCRQVITSMSSVPFDSELNRGAIRLWDLIRANRHVARDMVNLQTQTRIWNQPNLLAPMLEDMGLGLFALILRQDPAAWTLFVQRRSAGPQHHVDTIRHVAFLHNELGQLTQEGPMVLREDDTMRDFIFQHIHDESDDPEPEDNMDVGALIADPLPAQADPGAEFPGFQGHVSSTNPGEAGPAADAEDEEVGFENVCLYCTARFLGPGQSAAEFPDREPEYTLYCCGQRVGEICFHSANARKCPFCGAWL